MTNGAFSPEDDPKMPPLAEIYNDSAALYRKTFPEKLANLFITRGAEHLFLSPDVANLLTENIADIKEMVTYKAGVMRDQGWSAMATTFSVTKNGVETQVNHLLLPEGESAGFVSSRHPAEMNQIGIFDHEMGHFIVRNGRAENTNLAECAADAYAALRHIQRFGAETDMLAHAAAKRADNIVLFAAADHYTSAVFEEIKTLQDAGETDIKSLSLPQTAALAEKIAAACALDGGTLDRVYRAYAGLRAALAGDAPDPVAGIRAAAAAVVENKDDPAVCRAGRFFLDSPRIQSFIAAAALADDPLILKSRAVGAAAPPAAKSASGAAQKPAP